jgi:hypothetical protein
MEKKRKIYDLDAAFDERIGEYMKKQKGKFTAEEWEDKIPVLYQQFSQTVIDALGATPKEYYARMSQAEIAAELQAHFAQNVPVDGFLRAAAEDEKNEEILFSLLNGSEEEAIFAVEILRDKERAIPVYLQLLARPAGENLQAEIADILKDQADRLAGELVALYYQGTAGNCIAHILSRCVEQREDVFSVLLDFFRAAEHLGEGAELLAQYGDERALPVIQERMSEEMGYSDWKSLKYAAESLGGKVADRDFSFDKDYIKCKEEEERQQAERNGERKE